jgi:ISXO2-like transposase domain
MQKAGLHAGSGNGPDLRAEVDLVPRRTQNLAGSGRRQDQEFERQCRDRFSLAQLGNEGRNLGIGQGRMLPAGKILHERFLTKRINHEECYSDGAACTNQAESFFSRLRRAEIGTHHHISGRYLSAYASEMAWREDNRRVSNGEQYLMATNAALKHSVSRQWKGYWQHATS